MEWQQVEGGCARRFILEDGAPVIAVLRDADDQRHVMFYSNVEDFDRIQLDSEKLGGLSDLIDALQPEDVIEICCRAERTSTVR